MKSKKIIDSPNGKYSCHIGKILELNKAAFGAKFFFTDNQNNVLYHVKNSYLHELQSDDNPTQSLSIDEGFKLLQWSNDSNSVYFLQYSILAATMYYKSIFIDFSNRCLYVIDENIFKFRIVNSLSVLDKPFDMQITQRELIKFEIYPIPLSQGNVSD